MLKLAVIGAGSLLGRELVDTLEARDCSVLPLTAGPMTLEEEDGDLVVFAPEPALLEDIDVVVLAETPAAAGLLAAFPGRILDLRDRPGPGPGAHAPGRRPGPRGTPRLRGRPALEQVLATLPRLVDGPRGGGGHPPPVGGLPGGPGGGRAHGADRGHPQGRGSGHRASWATGPPSRWCPRRPGGA